MSIGDTFPWQLKNEGSKEKEAAAEAKQAENMASFEESTAELNAQTMAEAVKKSYESDEETFA